MSVRVERVLRVGVPEEQDYGAPFFDNGPGYQVVQVRRRSGLLGKLPGTLKEQVVSRVGEDGMLLAEAKKLAQELDQKYSGGSWVVKESPHRT